MPENSESRHSARTHVPEPRYHGVLNPDTVIYVAFSPKTPKEQCRVVSRVEQESQVGNHRKARSKTHDHSQGQGGDENQDRRGLPLYPIPRHRRCGSYRKGCGR